jgi:hypothetical protein
MLKNIIVSAVTAIVVLVVGLAVIGSVANAPVSTGLETGSVNGPIQNSVWNFQKGASFGSNKYAQFSQSGIIAAGANQASWQNRTGRTIYINRHDVSTTGTASSTYALYVYASTSPARTIYDFVAPASANRMLINNFALATSSAATTTSSLDKALAGKVVQVPDGSYVDIQLSSAAPGCPSVAGVCESATSTNRGFNLEWYFEGYYAP